MVTAISYLIVSILPRPHALLEAALREAPEDLLEVVPAFWLAVCDLFVLDDQMACFQQRELVLVLQLEQLYLRHQIVFQVIQTQLLADCFLNLFLAKQTSELCCVLKQQRHISWVVAFVQLLVQDALNTGFVQADVQIRFLLPASLLLDFLAGEVDSQLESWDLKVFGYC